MENTSQVQASQEAANTLALYQLSTLVSVDTLAYAAAECRSNAHAEHTAGHAHTAADWEAAAELLGKLYKNRPA